MLATLGGRHRDCNLALSHSGIGLYGGSFDPPHAGHKALVSAGLELLGLDEIWVIPALPVHRRLSGHADGPTRLRWLQQVFAGDDRIRVLDCEIRRGRPTPMVETLREFADAHAPVVPWLMLGADAWAGLPDWIEYPAHQGLCNVAVFARQTVKMESPPVWPGWRRVDMHDWRCQREPGHMVYVPVRLPDISATALRNDLAAGGRLADCIPQVIRPEVREAYAQ